MMGSKAMIFGDQDLYDDILANEDPAVAQKLGRRVRGFDQRIWEQRRFDVVVRGNLAKFSQDPSLENVLVETGDAVLVESSPKDEIWGIGLAEGHPDVKNPRRWRGYNLLGFALMRVREILSHRR